MIIVSQDKKKTVENLNLGIRNEGEYNSNYIIYNTKIGTDLGEYVTEERAKEVLREIIKQKVMFELFRTAPAGGKEQTEMLEKFAQKKIIFDTYEMPEE